MSKRNHYMAGAGDPHVSGAERRQSCRYPLAGGPATLGWWEGDEFHTVAAVLKNLSLDGALTLVESPPPPGVAVWITVGREAPSDWVEATVVLVSKDRRGPKQVRLKFRTSCPYEFFDSVIRSMASRPETEPVAKEFDGRYWR